MTKKKRLYGKRFLMKRNFWKQASVDQSMKLSSTKQGSSHSIVYACESMRNMYERSENESMEVSNAKTKGDFPGRPMQMQNWLSWRRGLYQRRKHQDKRHSNRESELWISQVTERAMSGGCTLVCPWLNLTGHLLHIIRRSHRTPRLGGSRTGRSPSQGSVLRCLWWDFGKRPSNACGPLDHSP